MKKINVVWICTISNPQIHSHISFRKWQLKNCIKFLLGKPLCQIRDWAQWNTNGIREFEKFTDVKLTIIFPYMGITGQTQWFTINNIDYICYRTDNDNLFSSFQYLYMKRLKQNYPKARKIVKSLIDKIQPDIVHIIGAENPPYSICALDVAKTIPCVLSLQTLLADPTFYNYHKNEWSLYQYRREIERKVIIRSDYIASRVSYFCNIVRKDIKKDAMFLQMPLALGVDVIDTGSSIKEYDFVYFAKNINKAADYAIEAFSIVHKKYPFITLNISGSYEADFKSKLDARIKELNIEKSVFITGPKQTHEEVLEQVKKSRYAVLPLKVDLISGTIREAMACGLPTVTTITPSTPNLNKNRESILLSKKEDFQSMADNMLRLLEDETYADQIRNNAYLTIKEKYSNEASMKMWRKAYYEIIENFKNGTPFSKDVIYEGAN